MQQPPDSSTPQATRAFRPRVPSGDRGTPQNDAGPACDDRGDRNVGGLKVVTSADLNNETLAGFRLSNYELGHRIGSGGMGQVYSAKHVALGKSFAIKFMSDEVRNCTEGGQRFRQEVLSLGQLRHPNIVSAVDAGSSGTLQYLVTELIDGTDLAQLVRQTGTLSETQAREIIIQAAHGLSHAHQLGFIHRDVKPSNIILDKHGVVRLLDFGLVRNQNRTDDVTSVGQLLGTVDFLSPEQAADGRIADHRSDLYGLGCTLLYLLTGHTPFHGEQYNSIASRIHGHLFAEPPAMNLLSHNVTPFLKQCLSRLLAKKPNDRFQSADEFIAALNGTTATLPPAPPTKPRRWMSNAVTSSLAVCVAFFSIADIGRRFASDLKRGEPLTSFVMTHAGDQQRPHPRPASVPAENASSENLPSTSATPPTDSGSTTAEPSETPVNPPGSNVTPEPDQRPGNVSPSVPSEGPIDWAASNEKFLKTLPVKPSSRDRSQLLNHHPKFGALETE